MAYTLLELWNDLANYESNLSRIQHSSQELGHGGVGIRAIERGTLEEAIALEMHRLQQCNNTILSRMHEHDAVDRLRVYCEAENGDFLTTKFLRQLRGRVCQSRRCSIEQANKITVKEFVTMMESEKPSTVPLEITDSLARFREEHPDPKRVAFLMMQFEHSEAVSEIVKQIRATFEDFGIKVVRADDKEYHDDLLPNIKTYMHGCGLGIGLFERIQNEYFNPNVSLEIGYMMALGKPVCLLKDETLDSLNTDLVGRLYKSFDTRSPSTSIPPAIRQWLLDRNFVLLNSFFDWARGNWHLSFGQNGQEHLTITADGKYLTSNNRERELTIEEFVPGERVKFKKRKVHNGQWTREILEIDQSGEVMVGHVEGGHKLRYVRTEGEFH